MMQQQSQDAISVNGVLLSRVGLGSWAIGGGGLFGWGHQDDQDSIDTMNAAVEAGINWIDTAPVYGRGHSEAVVGRFLKDLPPDDRPMVLTKCGIVWDSAGSTRTLHPDSIRAECEASLQRLGVEALDMLQFHQPDEVGTPIEDSWAAMLQLLEEGKIRSAGVSNYEGSALQAVCDQGHLTSVQSPMSLIDRGIGSTIVPWARERNVGVLVYSPMASGLLTDSFTAERASSFPEDDWRSRHPQFQEPNLARNLALRDAIGKVAESHSTTVSAVAVAWTLSWPGVSAAIVGGRRPDQLSGWVDAVDLDLTTEDLAAIESALVETAAGSGPTSPAGSVRPATE